MRATLALAILAIALAACGPTTYEPSEDDIRLPTIEDSPEYQKALEEERMNEIYQNEIDNMPTCYVIESTQEVICP